MENLINSIMYAFRIAVGISMLIFLLGNGAAAIISVPDDYARIQWAIDNATDGNTIEVHSGIYYENLSLNKKLTLRGIGMPVVDAMGNGSTITLLADGISLEGFTTTGSGSYPEAGIKIASSKNVVIGNNASNNNGNGISVLDSNNNTLSGNNASSNKYYGIELTRSSNNTLRGNNASNNNNGIYLYDYSGNNSLNHNNANSNNYHGIRLYFSGNNTLTGNNASNNINNGFTLDYSGNNTLSDNHADSNTYEGIYLSSSNNNTLIGNNASNNANGIYLESSSSNTIYDNYFTNNNAFDDGNNIWNINKTSRTNIINGEFSGGNFWSDYAGKDTDGDGLGNTMLPYDSWGEIANGGDYLPLIVPLPFSVNINISRIPVITKANSNILVEFTNFSPGDPYNISINAPNGTRVYYDNSSLTGTKLQIIPINWTPQSTGNYTTEAWGRGMIDSAPVYVYDSKVVPVSGLGLIVLIAAVMLGFIGTKRKR
jgi:parallel beta-helix repeat protein